MSLSPAVEPVHSIESARVEYRILGPLTVEIAGRHMSLGGPRQRMVLAMLLSRPNRTIPQDQLIEDVWSGDPPKTAKSTLQSYIYALRQELGSDSILRRGEGYVVEADESSLDGIRFESLVRSGRAEVSQDPAAAASLLTHALGLWYGLPFGDLGTSLPLIAEVARLQEMRLLAVESRVDAGLIAGDHVGLVAELDSLVREYPLRERFWEQYMLALYRSGRQADALRAYQRARVTLADELGIDPSHDLQRLELRILEQDPELTLGADSEWIQDASGDLRAVRGYELREAIAEGELATVFRVFQPSMSRELAMKVMRPEHANRDDFVRDFEHESQRSAQLEHPHIVPIFDAWRDPSGAYLVMPLMRGGDLSSAIPEEGWSPTETVNLLEHVGGALAYAHRQGAVHGDVTASRVLLDEEGNAYLAGFGIASRFSDEATMRRESKDLVAPERVRGEAPSVSTDIFGLGVLAHSMITGAVARPPLPLPAIGNGRPGATADIDRAIAKATDPDPAQRHETIDDFLVDLRRVVGSNVLSLAPPRHRPTADEPVRNPYKGLMAFVEADEDDFYGRDALIDEVVRAVGSHNVVTVTGPSGSGKSSLVRAGVVPALRSGGLPGSDAWLVTDMFPGSYPFEELETALLRVAVDRPAALLDQLLQPHGLLRAAKQILGEGNVTLVLVIDQFEELFSLAVPETTRRQFIDELVAIAGDRRGRIKVILTMRADFITRALDYSDFAVVIGQGVVTVGTPTSEGLTHAIVEPAHGVGVDLEPGLVGRVIGDVQDQPGALPLFQYALTELFSNRTRDILTIADYQATGGVLGSLGRRSESLFAELSPEAQAAAHQLFLRLVAVDEFGVVTRRRARQSELRSLGVDPGPVEEVIDLYGSYRLLSFDKDPVSRSPTVEVAHEALLHEWPRYRDWIEARRDSLALSRKIGVASQEWIDSDRDPSFLLRGARLEQALEWQDSANIALTGSETEYLEASTDLEYETANVEHRRRRRVVGVLTAVIVILAALGGFALAQRRAALEAADLAFAGELAAEASAAIEADPELTLLLAIEAAQIHEAHGEPPSDAVVTVLRRGIGANRLEARLEGGPFIRMGPDGLLLSAGTARGDLTVWRIETSDPVTVIPEGQVSQSDLDDSLVGSWDEYDLPIPGDAEIIEQERPSFQPDRFLYSPDEMLLAAASISTVGVLDPANETFWSRDDLDRVGTMTWSSDGAYLIVGGEGTLDVLDAKTGDLVRRVPGPLSGVTSLVSVPGTSLVAASDHFGEQILLIDVGDTGEFEIGGFGMPFEVWEMTVTEDRLFAADLSSHVLANPTTGELTVSRGPENAAAEDRLGGQPATNDTASLVSGVDGDGQPAIWSANGDPFHVLPENSRAIAISGDGTLAITNASFGSPQLIGIPGGDVVASLSIPGEMQRAWFSPDDRYVVVRSFEPSTSTTSIWETATGTRVGEVTSPWSGLGFDFTPDGALVVLGTSDGLISILDFNMLASGSTPEEALIRESIPAHNALIVDLDVSPDGSMIASSALDQPARLWDLESGQLLSELGTRARTRIAFHPTQPWLYVAEGPVVSIHTLDIDELVGIAQQRLTRDLTAEECFRYLGDSCEPGS